MEGGNTSAQRLDAVKCELQMEDPDCRNCSNLQDVICVCVYHVCVCMTKTWLRNVCPVRAAMCVCHSQSTKRVGK